MSKMLNAVTEMITGVDAILIREMVAGNIKSAPDNLEGIGVYNQIKKVLVTEAEILDEINSKLDYLMEKKNEEAGA